jgi:DNA polymerase III subunit beta
MKLTLPTKPFIAELKALLPAVATRPGLPMLSGVRLDASDDGLAVEATDLELTGRRVVHDDVTVDGTGSVVAPAKELIKALKAMTEPEIDLESDPTGARAEVCVRVGARTVTLQGWDVEDWPAVQRLAEVDPIASIEAPALADALERVVLCASHDESRPVLTCVALYFEEDPAGLEVVATDSYRLGATRVPVSSPVRATDGPLLVPARAVRLLAKQLKAADGTVQILALAGSGEDSWTERVGFVVPGAEWTVRAIDGEFPNWRQVVPEPDGGSFDFDPEEHTSALRAAASVRSTAGAPVRLSLDRTCSLTLREPDLGEMREQLAEARFTPNGPGAVDVAFNPDYLADAIRFCGAERGRMWVRDGLRPVLFEGPDRRYVLMPIRLP